MSQSLNNIDLSSLLPAFMRRQEDDRAMADALSAAIRPLSAEIAKLPTWGAISLLNEDELDALAAEIACIWYEEKLTPDQKRALLLDSDHVYQRLGTRAAVQEVASIVFGSAAVQEFWEYDTGRPHHFRIAVPDPSSLDSEHEARLIRLLDQVKRKTQWLDSIIATTPTEAPLNIGAIFATHNGISSAPADIDIAEISPSPTGGTPFYHRWYQIDRGRVPEGSLVGISLAAVPAASYRTQDPVFLAIWYNDGPDLSTGWQFLAYSQQSAQPRADMATRWTFDAVSLPTDSAFRISPISLEAYAAGEQWDVTAHLQSPLAPVPAAEETFTQTEGETRQHRMPEISLLYLS